MYTLYSEQPGQSLRWLADVANEERARALASVQSKYRSQPVLIVRRFEDGDSSCMAATFRGRHPQAMKSPG